MYKNKFRTICNAVIYDPILSKLNTMRVKDISKSYEKVIKLPQTYLNFIFFQIIGNCLNILVLIKWFCTLHFI